MTLLPTMKKAAILAEVGHMQYFVTSCQQALKQIYTNCKLCIKGVVVVAEGSGCAHLTAIEGRLLISSLCGVERMGQCWVIRRATVCQYGRIVEGLAQGLH